MTSQTLTKTPAVGPLYFAGSNDVDSLLSTLPSEILTKCLVEYADWGDLAKLACVQSCWSTLLLDAAADEASRWELAQALLDGTNGLAVNHELAMTLLEDLSGVTVVDGEELETYDYEIVGTPFAPAMKRLADCYLKEDDDETTMRGITWLTAAYELGGDVNAAHELAVIYEYGKNNYVSLDVYVAADWFLKAAQGGHVEAMAEYAMCCELGCGVDQSDEEALEWYMKAAHEGHVTSNYSVGEAFEEARGVPQSDEEACLWYYKAAVLGDDCSKDALRRLRDIARIVLPGVSNMLQEDS